MDANLPLLSSGTLQAVPPPRLLKLLLFRIGSLHLALSLDSVRKVANYTTVYGSGTTPVGIAHLEDREVTVLDLHRRLFRADPPASLEAKKYLILAENSLAETLAIVVGEAPTLVDVPASQIRQLPDSYRRADTLEMASHVAIVPQGGQSLTVFLLDADRLVRS